jgi:hypothetical protein
MIIFVDDEGPLRSWLMHHRQGYALEGMRNRKATRLLLHRAPCSELKDSLRLARATTHRRWVACSSTRGELTAWSTAEYETEPIVCEVCLQDDVQQPPSDAAHHLTRLARDVLDYVLDVALVHMEPDAKPYRLTVADIAQCLGKTCGQLTHALEHLAAEDIVAIEEHARKRSTSGDHRVVYPTANALRKLPYFSEWDQASLEAEVVKLETLP